MPKEEAIDHLPGTLLHIEEKVDFFRKGERHV
jgi:hypothetical protein